MKRIQRMPKAQKAKSAKTRRSWLVKDSHRNWWRFYSQQVTMINAAMLTTYVSLPDKLQDAIPPLAVIGLALGLLALGFVVRMIKQPGKP